ncbi:hypothetical protein [Rubrobacter marinus]|uniref:hypothetical protein n=1 Tax=Rubrobacter marinus TaxID=2653852 RepID=UPI00140DCC02|nr:hypothetical protein [Rubrobacter marinus]
MLATLGAPGAGLIPPVLFGGAGLAFLYAFFGDVAGRPWAALPGFSLLGIAASALLRTISAGTAAGWAGSFLLGGIGVGFFAVYLAGRKRPWVLVAGGAALTVAVVMAGLPVGLGEATVAGTLLLGPAVALGLLAHVTDRRRRGRANGVAPHPRRRPGAVGRVVVVQGYHGTEPLVAHDARRGRTVHHPAPREIGRNARTGRTERKSGGEEEER